MVPAQNVKVKIRSNLFFFALKDDTMNQSMWNFAWKNKPWIHSSAKFGTNRWKG